MTAAEVIRKKRDGHRLQPDEIRYFIREYMKSQVTDYQMSALLMAIFLNGFDRDETVVLMREMRDSGKTLDLSSLPGRKVDKHSTGGVGDKTSLIIAPIAAACGVTVPMITGRTLGHTGGTLDKLEAIPGFNCQPTPDEILSLLRSNGAVIMGQTSDLAPVDRRMYALRDVTATVESIPLITASILSKKLAEDIDALVMDVKTGSGAFMTSVKQASVLARSIVEVCRRTKTKVVALITDMDQPLGRAVGNALEVQECVDVLHGRGEQDLVSLSIALAAHMIHCAGRARSMDSARRMAQEAISSGRAAERFRDIVRSQGGDPSIMERPDILPRAANIRSLRASADGFVRRCDARLIGLAANALGGGRNRMDDVIDPAVGLYLEKKVGDRVSRGETLCRIHWNDPSRLKLALPMAREAFETGVRPVRKRPLIHSVLTG